MTTQIEYALLAGASYYDTRKEQNRLPLPQNWSYVSRVQQDLTTGFEAAAFTNGTELVVSFAGTYPKNPDGSSMPLPIDLQADVDLATGKGARGYAQLLQAAEYYLDVKRQNPNATITLTGHSLGGGIAALVGVFFHAPVTAFDQAPFANCAQSNSLLSNPLNIFNPDVAADLKASLVSAGYTDSELAPLTNFLLIRPTDGSIPNSNWVNNIRVDGEFLSTVLPFNQFDTIGNTPVNDPNASSRLLTHGTTDISAFTGLHDITLLTAFLQSEQGAPTDSTGKLKSLSEVTFKLKDLLGMFFDTNLYSFDTDKPDSSFREHLVRHQTGGVDGVQAGGDAMVTRFTADLWKLAQDGGMTMNEGIWSNYSNWNNVSKALTAFAMQFYYEDTANAVDKTKQLFTDLTTAGTGSNGIQFDMHDVSKDIAAAMDANAQVDLTKAKGYQYFLNYLDTTSTFTPQERALIKTMLPQLRDWYVQAGAAGMTAADTMGRGAFMLGGNSGDAMAGSNKTDLLVGNAGDDIFLGNKGNDVLLGGTGNDIYDYAQGDGLDTILDTDGNGTLQIDNNAMSGGEQLGDNKVFRGKDANGVSHLYTFVTGDRTTGGDLMVDGAMLIKDYKPGLGNHMGISFSDAFIRAANNSAWRVAA